MTPDESFEKWLRTVCFQKPTPEAYDLAKCAYLAGREEGTKRTAQRCVEICRVRLDAATAADAIEKEFP